jgi:hypothetical protein
MHTEQVTDYIALDGKRFRDREKCLAYEQELRAVNAIMDRLPKCDPGDGEYFQHDKETLLDARRGLWAMILDKYGESYPEWKKWHADKVHPLSGVGRVLDDFGGNPIADAWRHLARINWELYREYQQPYYAINPGQATKEVK